jgi:Immunity protein 50
MTDWTDLLDDPRAIRAIFGDAAPSLDQIELLEVVLHTHGPTAIIRFNLAAFPIDPPKKWLERGCNTVQVRLQAIGVLAVEVQGLVTSPVLNLEIRREGEALRVTGSTEDMSVDITTEWLAITGDSVSAYTDDRS